ncbi:hypothetical protein DL764_006485 [Monosporascus ibericus]|uniref:CCHC-type domain-containing protein n=1 Tax=Monosporascus ibericus TaxID=155417 RepID=A0A4Q4T4L9_9PEZI|nr:hypothetical protein DL764_006485 [Monosporascus ibericus]
MAVKIDDQQYAWKTRYFKDRQNNKPRHPPNTSTPRGTNISHGTAPGPMELGAVQQRDPRIIKCFNCNKMGHKVYQCKAPKKPRQNTWTPVP